jgi:hypothetical protein
MTDIEYPLEAPSAKVCGEPRLLRKRRVQVASRNAQDRCVVVAWLQQSVEAERRSRKPLNPAAEVPARNVRLLTHATQQKGDCRMRANTLCHAHLALSPALTAVARCFVLSLDSEQVVTKKAVRLHCHSVPRSGSDTACGRPTATAAPTATIATAAIASVLDLCQMNLMAFSDFRGLKSALFKHDSL